MTAQRGGQDVSVEDESHAARLHRMRYRLWAGGGVQERGVVNSRVPLPEDVG